MVISANKISIKLSSVIDDLKHPIKMKVIDHNAKKFLI